MPKHKDLKRLVRARMKKTGESYTTARMHLTGGPPPAEGPVAKWAELAEMPDENVRENSGKGWVEWVEALDAIGATEMSHRDIAKHVGELGVPGWWAQTVTVGYERIRGLREKNQKRDGSFEAGKSKTLGASLDAVWALCAEEAGRAAWIEEPVGLRKLNPKKTVRLDWPDGSRVVLNLVEKGPAKCTVTVVHEKLGSSAEVAAAKKAWGARLGALARALTA